MENQKIKKSAGRLSPTPMGDYDDTTTYRRLDWVYYGGTTYICKKNNTLGIKPSDPERWQKIIDEIGDMKIIFTEAEQLENITNGDKLSIIFGKIKKWFTHFNDIICRDNNDTKVTRIRADEGVQVSNRANDRHIPVYASDFVAGTGGTTGRSLANLSLKDLSDNNYIDVLTNINQITSIGFWKIGSIDSSYAQSIGIRAVDNVGDFYALVSNYNGDGSRFNYGNLQLFSPRLGVNHFEIRVSNVAAAARHAITYDTMLNTTEQISANTESFYAAGALAVKAMMADYNNKINQINSNLIIYRTWQFLTESEAIIISPHTIRYFGIERPVVEGYTCIGVSLQEKHGVANGYLLVTYTETLMTVHNPRDTDIYFWGAVFKFVYIKR